MDTTSVALDSIVFTWKGMQSPVLTLETVRWHTGERVFVQGPSGCGKSTLLGLLAGLHTPDHGSVRIMGTDWQRLRPAQRDRFRADHIGYIFQQFNLIPYLSAMHNVTAPCHFSRYRYQRAVHEHGSIEQAARHLLDALGLPAHTHTQQASSLSVGQQQRVAAARALMGQPEVIIADEPTSALDAENTHTFMNLLLQHACTYQSTLIFVSHDHGLSHYFDTLLTLPAQPYPST